LTSGRALTRWPPSPAKRDERSRVAFTESFSCMLPRSPSPSHACCRVHRVLLMHVAALTECVPVLGSTAPSARPVRHVSRTRRWHTSGHAGIAGRAPAQVLAKRPLDRHEADVFPGNGVRAKPADLRHVAPRRRLAYQPRHVDDGEDGDTAGAVAVD